MAVLLGNLQEIPICFRTFLSLLLGGQCRNVCYNAQELIIFLIEKYGFETEQGD